MRYAIIILAFLFCTIKTDAQVYQAMPQAGYGPVKRMLIDSVLTIPIGLSQLRNITGGRDTAQIRYQKSDSSVYVYSGSTWIKLGTGGGGGGSADSTVFFTVYRADTMRANIYARIVTTDSAVYFTKYRSDTMRANIYSYIKNVDSLTYFTKYRSDTMRANIYAAIPQPDTFFVKYPVRVNNDTILLAQGFVDSVYNVSTGDATRLVTTVYNNTGSTITKGSVVYINGRHSSNLPTIALAQANDEANSYKTFALVETDITTSNSGRVIQAGRINNLNLPTSTYTDGDILYLSPTVAGGYTTTKPLAPNHICKLGSVTRAHPTLGGIEVKIENGWELMEMSDVQISSVPADSTLLQFSRVDSLWHDVSPATALGNRTWRTEGNGSVNSNYFLGSTNNASVRFRTNNTERLIIDSIGGMQMASVSNNGTLTNALQLANTNNRSFFNISTNSNVTNLTIKANTNSVLDSFVIADSGLIAPRTNATMWLRPNQTGNNNIVATRCAACGTGSIFSANVGTSAPIFNMLSTGQMSINGETPASTSALDITSTTRGLLIPRMTTSQRNAISTPATGLMIWNTDDTTLHNYTGNTWRRMISANPNGTINYTAPTQTGSNANGIMSLAQTWNTTGNVSGLSITITNTASGTSSRIFDVVVDGSREFAIDRQGTVGSISTTRYQGFSYSAGGGSTSNATYYNCTGSNSSNNAGTTANAFQSAMSFSPSSNNAVFNNFSAIPTINQTGTASGISRGLFVNPTLTSAVDFRAIEATNGSIVLPYATASATYAIKTSDYLLNFTSGTFTATLPTAVGCTGKIYVLKNSGTGAVTIATTSSQTIDGATTYSLGSQYKFVHVVSNGSNWIITSSN